MPLHVHAPWRKAPKNMKYVPLQYVVLAERGRIVVRRDLLSYVASAIARKLCHVT